MKTKQLQYLKNVFPNLTITLSMNMQLYGVLNTLDSSIILIASDPSLASWTEWPRDFSMCVNIFRALFTSSTIRMCCRGRSEVESGATLLVLDMATNASVKELRLRGGFSSEVDESIDGILTDTDEALPNCASGTI